MKQAIDIIIKNRAIRERESVKAGDKIVHTSTQSLQSKIENAAMVANRYGTPMDEAQKIMGMTEQQIEDFRRN